MPRSCDGGQYTTFLHCFMSLHGSRLVM